MAPQLSFFLRLFQVRPLHIAVLPMACFSLPCFPSGLVGTAKKNKTHCVLWENVIPFRALIFKIFPYWEVLSRQRCATPPVCCCVISGYVSQRNSGSGCVLASGCI